MAAAVSVAALLAAGGVVVIPATPAFAVGCYDTSCVGKNPVDMGCTGIETVGYAFPQQGETVPELDLRYSPTCDAYWALIWGEVTPGLLEVIGRVCSGEPGPTYRCRPVITESSWDDASSTRMFTLMIPGDYLGRACWADYGTAWTCTL